MLDELKMDLQLFGEGGDGGAAGDGGNSGGDAATGEINIPSSIPERARENYKKAMAKTTAESKPEHKEEIPAETTTAEQVKPSYYDMISSDAYKAEHEKYMKKTIGDRLKKYDGIEAELGRAKNALEIIAQKYSIDPAQENFIDKLTAAIEGDVSVYEDYAAKHDLSPQEAMRVMQLERKVQKQERERAEASKQEAMRQQFNMLRQNAEKTKARFPDFDLEREMQDERFCRLCAVNNGDTTAAYMACHWENIIPNAVNTAAQQAAQQTAAAVAANKARPAEAGLSSSASSVSTQDFSRMNLTQLRAYAEEQRRLQNKRR